MQQQNQKGPDISEVFQELANNSSRLRQLEERYNNLRKKIQVIEENMLNTQRTTNLDIESIHGELTDMTLKINDFRDKLDLIINDLRSTAKQEDVALVKKYMDLWNPIHFVTHSEVEKIVNQILEDKTN